MAETCVERLRRVIDEKNQEDRAAIQAVQAQADAAKLVDLANRDVDAEMQALDAEMDPMTDAELKAKDKNYLYSQLERAKELQEEKNRRSGG